MNVTFSVKYFLWLSCILEPVLSTGFCRGVPEENAEGTECHKESGRVYCSEEFEIGTVLRYRCADRYKPAWEFNCGSNDSSPGSELNPWTEVACLPEQVWSSPYFVTFVCEREPNLYCGPGWTEFFKWYEKRHVLIIIVLCTLGCLTNLVNMIVFTRPKMRNPLNMVLGSLAVTDFLFMLEGLIEHSRIWHRIINGDNRKSYGQMVEFLTTQLFYYLFHTWSIYLTLLVAFLRFYGVHKPLQSRRYTTKENVRWGISLTIICSGLLVPAMYWGTRVKKVNMDSEAATPQISVTSTDEDPPYMIFWHPIGTKMLFWIYAIMVKLVPCVTLSFLIIGLIRCLIKATQSRKEMRGSERSGGESEFDMTTIMLVAMLTFFVLTESPDAIVSMLYVCMPPTSALTVECLKPMVNFLRLLEFLSCLSSIFFYVGMSQAYRMAFKGVVVGAVGRVIGWGGRLLRIVFGRRGTEPTPV